MKRIYTFLLLSLLVWSAAMAEVVSGTCGANGDNLTWTLDTETGALVISGEGAMANYEWKISPWYSYRSNIVSVEITDGVTTIGDHAFSYCSGLTSLTIPNSVTTIGHDAFSSCSGLTSLTIPNSVTTIGDWAFYDCDGLTSLTIPNSVTEIGESAFRSCSGLTSLTIPNSVTEIGEYAFGSCSGLTSLTIPNSVTTIGEAAFLYCSGLTSLTIPNSVTTIGHDAFCGCSGLTSLTIPNSVTTIGERAFFGCSGLTSLTIPNSVTTIEFGAFASCSGLISISVVGDNPYYDSRNDCNAVIETASNTLVAGCKNTEFPNSVTTIGDGAFGFCSGLTSLTIPNSVTEIGHDAFNGCSSLTSLTIPNSVTEIGYYAFRGCSGLTSLTIPNSVTTIGHDAFSSCSGLTSLTIPNSVTEIGEYAFGSCSGLTSLTMKSTTPPSTASDAFSNCNALTTIYVPVGAAANYDVAPWNSYEIIESIFTSEGIVYSIESDSTVAIKTTDNTFCPSHTFVYELPNQVLLNGVKYYKVTSIRDSAFYECETIPPLVDIPNSIISIGHYAFANTILKQIRIPSSVTSIALTSFRGCNQLQYIHIDEQNPIYDSRENCRAIIETASNTLLIGCKESSIPNSITKIGEFAFSNVHGLSSLEIPNSVISIERFAFNECTNLGSIVIPNSVVDLGDGIFWCCTNLETATIGDSVKEIPYNAFWNCPKLSQIKLGKSVQKINTQAFLNCGIKTIIIPASIESIESSAFAGCDSLESIIIHSTTPPNTDIDAFYRCNALNTIYVPVGAAANYDVAPWNSYNIVEMSTKVQVDNLWYNLDFENQTAEVTNSGTTGEYSGSIVIPGNISVYGETFVVTAIGEDAFYGCFGLTGITIPNSVTEIGDLAFLSCSGLTSLTIPNSVTTIGQSAFNGCFGLTSISVADDNPYYDSRNDCNAIIETASNTLVAGCKNTVIPNSVTEIGNGAFSDCFGLTSLTIPNSVTTIGDLAFWNCFGLTSLTIPNSVTTIGNCAFYGCSGLTSLTIPNSVTTIGDRAFYDCSGLTSLTIPNSVTTIEFGAFAFCSGLTSISVAADNPYYDSRNDCNAIIETASNTLVAGCKNTEIPNSVTTIGGGAFGGCSGLTSLTIPNSVTKIGDYAFEGCSGLTSLTIPNSVTKIGEYAFRSCSGLTSLTMKSATPPYTGSDVFSYCYDLTTIYVPFGAAANYDVAPWNSYEIVEALGVVSSNPATGEEVEGLSVITLTFNKEIKSINESLIKLTATSSSTQVPVSVQINATNTKALTITLSQAVYNGDTYVLTLAAGAVTAMDDKSNEEALEMSYVVTTKPLEDVDLSKLYRIKDVGTRLYLNAANYDVHEQGTHGGVNAVEKANSDDQVFTLSRDGNNFKLQTASGKYIYCQGWNVDALDEGTALTFVPVEEGAFYIMRGSQYFKIEEVESVYYPFCDAPESKRAKFVLEEVVRVALTDGEDYTQADEMEAERITYTRNFKNTYYQPWYVPFDVEYDEIIDRFVVAELNDIHQFDDNDDGEFERWAIEVLQLKRGDVISANHPYMIKARTAGEQSIVVENTTLYPADLNTIDCSSTKMLYTFEPTYTTLSGSVLRAEGCYVVGSGKLVMPTDGSVVKANRWYLRPEPRNGGSLLSAPKQIQIFERDENGLTDIEAAIEESEQTTWPADVYDLNGRLVRKAATNMDGLNKGMYIVNGKKIVK